MRFGKPMESALALRMLWVEDGAGKRVAGKASLSDHERVWTFAPAAAWRPGAYRLVADTRLEDLAGNSIGRPFEVDMRRPAGKAVRRATAKVGFRVE